MYPKNPTHATHWRTDLIEQKLNDAWHIIAEIHDDLAEDLATLFDCAFPIPLARSASDFIRNGALPVAITRRNGIEMFELAERRDRRLTPA